MTKLDELVSCIKDKHVYIQPHNYPDQDALASAYGLSVLLESRGISSTICYKGQVDKLNTLTMIQVLELDLVKIEDEKDMTEESEIIIVDGQKGNVNVRDFIGDEIACIDHHKKQRTDIYRFSDIRSDVGACSSIIAHYFVENNVEITTRVATALLYGIKMDTNNMSRGVSELDLDMFRMLYMMADQSMISKFESSTLQMSDLKAYATAIDNLKVYQRVGIVNIGENCADAILGTMSDFILSLYEVRFSVVYSRRGGGIKYSVRSEDESLDSAHIISEALSGYGSGGGHATMAAGFVPNVDEDEYADNLCKIIESRIIELVVKKIPDIYI